MFSVYQFLKFQSYKMSRISSEISRLSNKELENGVFDIRQSFHYDWKDIPYIKVQNLNNLLSEGDILTIFEQYGTVDRINLVRDESTGRSIGICILSYEDWRSTVLAVDNLNGIELMGRVICVTHTNHKNSKKVRFTDPRNIIPARFIKQDQHNFYDELSGSSTEYEEQ